MSKTLVITGGNSGIGLATATLFLKHHWLVYELSRHGESHDGIIHLTCDVTNPQQVREVVQQIPATDVLICNAGFGISGAVECTPYEVWQQQMAVNFGGAVNLTQALLPTMREQQHGRIIFVSSLAAVFPIPYQAFYSASKAAINTFAMALANEVYDFHISVCALLPGDVATRFTDQREKVLAGSELYPHMLSAVQTMEQDERGGMTPDYIAQRLYRLANRRTVKPFYVGGGISYRMLWFLKNFLPQRFVKAILGRLYR